MTPAFGVESSNGSLRETLNKSGWCCDRFLWEAAAHVSEANGAALLNCP